MSHLFVLGKIKSPEDHLQWEMQGIFSSRDKALSAYSRLENKHLVFIAPVTLDYEVPEVSSEWPQAYYPYYDYEGVAQ